MGLSFRGVSKVLRPFVDRSHVSVWRWVERLPGFRRILSARCRVFIFLVDETAVMERIVTGVRGLDTILKGGLPKGSVTAVIGPPGAGKTTLGMQFLLTGILLSRDSAYVLTFAPATLKVIAEGFGWNPTFIEKIEILDLFSKYSNTSSHYEHTADIYSLTDINLALGRMLEEVISENNMRLVIDSMSDIITLQKDEAVLNSFLRIVKSKLQAKGVTSLVLVEEGVHEPKTMSFVESVCDGTIKLKKEDDDRLLTVSRMLATPTPPGWRKFTISTGIEIISDEFFY
ncbi:MAG: ATPase domain-containing protein [Nitrososphaerota archaeon]